MGGRAWRSTHTQPLVPPSKSDAEAESAAAGVDGDLGELPQASGRDEAAADAPAELPAGQTSPGRSRARSWSLVSSPAEPVGAVESLPSAISIDDAAAKELLAAGASFIHSCMRKVPAVLCNTRRDTM